MAREKSALAAGGSPEALVRVTGLVTYCEHRLRVASEDQGVALAPSTTAYLAEVVASAEGPPDATLAELRVQALVAPPSDAPRRWSRRGEDSSEWRLPKHRWFRRRITLGPR